MFCETRVEQLKGNPVKIRSGPATVSYEFLNRPYGSH